MLAVKEMRSNSTDLRNDSEFRTQVVESQFGYIQAIDDDSAICCL